MDSITIKVSELFDLVKDMKSDGKDMVRLSFIEADEELPPAINFTAFNKFGIDEEDYEEIESCI